MEMKNLGLLIPAGYEKNYMLIGIESSYRFLR